MMVMFLISNLRCGSWWMALMSHLGRYWWQRRGGGPLTSAVARSIMWTDGFEVSPVQLGVSGCAGELRHRLGPSNLEFEAPGMFLGSVELGRPELLIS